MYLQVFTILPTEAADLLGLFAVLRSPRMACNIDKTLAAFWRSSNEPYLPPAEQDRPLAAPERNTRSPEAFWKEELCSACLNNGRILGRFCGVQKDLWRSYNHNMVTSHVLPGKTSCCQLSIRSQFNQLVLAPERSIFKDEPSSAAMTAQFRQAATLQEV